MNPYRDDELILAARRGDLDAFEELLGRHGPAVRRRIDIHPRWRTILDEDDVMQTTYLEAFLEIGRFTGNGDDFERWLARLAENNLTDAIRGLERLKRPHPDDRVRPPAGLDPLRWLLSLVTGTSTTPSGPLLHRELEGRLQEELAGLPADYGDVLRYSYLEGLTLKETAEAMKRSYGSIHMLRQRALSRLRQRMGHRSTALQL